MKLRKLKLKDAPLMLEWMHDESVTHDLQTNFGAKSIEDCEKFITLAQNFSTDIHLAIIDDNDEYMGTVSLKHISKIDAEFAITIRAVAMGRGYSKAAMAEIIRIGLECLRLERVYWCVSPDNKRAIHFYDKNGYQRISLAGGIRIKGYTKEQVDYFYWYEAR